MGAAEQPVFISAGVRGSVMHYHIALLEQNSVKHLKNRGMYDIKKKYMPSIGEKERKRVGCAMDWRGKLCRGLVSAALLGAMVLPASAAGYSDLPTSHWAYDEMSQAIQLKIINGVGGGLMAPEQELTCGQFLALLSRVCDGDGYTNLVAGGQSWDQAGVLTAQKLGLLPDNDFLHVTGDALARPITRQEVAVLLDRALPEDIDTPIYDWAMFEPIEENLLDWESMDPNYAGPVKRLYDLDVIRGNDKKLFGGMDSLRRADGTVLLMRTLELLDMYHYGDSKNIIFGFVDKLGQPLGEQMQLDLSVGDDFFWDVIDYIPDGYTTDYDTGDVSVVSVASSIYHITLRPLTFLERFLVELDQRFDQGEIGMQEYELLYPGENFSKSELLFGDPMQVRYEDQNEAQANMVTIQVPAWQLSGGTKVSVNLPITVHKSLADNVMAVFQEIYQDPEQFPIQQLGGFRWGDMGEHSCGTAIDINPDQNYQVRDGNAMVGSHWTPGTDPLSIAENGSVVRSFIRHGWSWGGDAWADDADPTYGYHDYMHFSYMGR